MGRQESCMTNWGAFELLLLCNYLQSSCGGSSVMGSSIQALILLLN